MSTRTSARRQTASRIDSRRSARSRRRRTRRVRALGRTSRRWRSRRRSRRPNTKPSTNPSQSWRNDYEGRQSHSRVQAPASWRAPMACCAKPGNPPQAPGHEGEEAKRFGLPDTPLHGRRLTSINLDRATAVPRVPRGKPGEIGGLPAMVAKNLRASTDRRIPCADCRPARYEVMMVGSWRDQREKTRRAASPRRPIARRSKEPSPT